MQLGKNLNICCVKKECANNFINTYNHKYYKNKIHSIYQTYKGERMQIDFTTIIFYALAIIIIYFVGYLIARPLKWLGKTLLWALPGGIALILVNILGGSYGLGIAINPITAVTAAFLGVPGVAMMLLLEVII